MIPFLSHSLINALGPSHFFKSSTSLIFKNSDVSTGKSNLLLSIFHTTLVSLNNTELFAFPLKFPVFSCRNRFNDRGSAKLSSISLSTNVSLPFIHWAAILAMQEMLYSLKLGKERPPIAHGFCVLDIATLTFFLFHKNL
ncbi:hypothetical protein GDO81_022787 [Engystomops pustulosus]|uniref:Uncharacterized protein n=1 Tax=Engystomops pustulosus TaxID=76066 RepID=A0AAV6YLP0_ENGPU|nr:hypothetical protein GDO81_022787 [Engystomops pustulosus]